MSIIQAPAAAPTADLVQADASSPAFYPLMTVFLNSITEQEMRDMVTRFAVTAPNQFAEAIDFLTACRTENTPAQPTRHCEITEGDHLDTTPPLDRRRFDGRLLRLARERASLTQGQLAERCIAQGTAFNRYQVQRAENGRAKPFPATIEGLAAALGVKPHDLLTKE